LSEQKEDFALPPEACTDEDCGRKGVVWCPRTESKKPGRQRKNNILYKKLNEIQQKERVEAATGDALDAQEDLALIHLRRTHDLNSHRSSPHISTAVDGPAGLNLRLLGCAFESFPESSIKDGRGINI